MISLVILLHFLHMLLITYTVAQFPRRPSSSIGFQPKLQTPRLSFCPPTPYQKHRIASKLPTRSEYSLVLPQPYTSFHIRPTPLHPRPYTRQTCLPKPTPRPVPPLSASANSASSSAPSCTAPRRPSKSTTRNSPPCWGSRTATAVRLLGTGSRRRSKRLLRRFLLVITDWKSSCWRKGGLECLPFFG
jgi:hypothetical protein